MHTGVFTLQLWSRSPYLVDACLERYLNEGDATIRETVLRLTRCSVFGSEHSAVEATGEALFLALNNPSVHHRVLAVRELIALIQRGQVSFRGAVKLGSSEPCGGPERYPVPTHNCQVSCCRSGHVKLSRYGTRVQHCTANTTIDRGQLGSNKSSANLPQQILERIVLNCYACVLHSAIVRTC